MRSGLISAVVILTLAVSGGAKAGTITEILNVTLNSGGLDIFGLFGPVNGSLNHDMATFSFSYDTAILASNSSYSQPEGAGSEQYADSTGDGVLSESITINGQTFTVANPSVAYVGGCDQCAAGVSDLFIEIRSVPTNPNSFLLFNFDSRAPYTDGTVLDQASISAFIASSVVYSATITFDDINDERISMIRPDAFSPEPSSWILLMLGFGGLVLLKQQQRRS
jgi:hypothetical protein